MRTGCWNCTGNLLEECLYCLAGKLMSQLLVNVHEVLTVDQCLLPYTCQLIYGCPGGG